MYISLKKVGLVKLKISIFVLYLCSMYSFSKSNTFENSNHALVLLTARN